MTDFGRILDAQDNKRYWSMLQKEEYLREQRIVLAIRCCLVATAVAVGFLVWRFLF